jgi:hypothetical protein
MDFVFCNFFFEQNNFVIFVVFIVFIVSVVFIEFVFSRWQNSFQQELDGVGLVD